MKFSSSVAILSTFLLLAACSDSTGADSTTDANTAVEEDNAQRDEPETEESGSSTDEPVVDDLEACEVIIGDGHNNSVILMSVDALSSVGPEASAVELGDIMQVQSIVSSMWQRTEGDIHDLIEPLHTRLIDAQEAISQGTAEEIDMIDVRQEANDLVDYCLDAGYTVDPSIPRK